MSDFRTALMALRQVRGQLTSQLSEEDAKTRERLLHTILDIVKELEIETEDDIHDLSAQYQGAE